MIVDLNRFLALSQRSYREIPRSKRMNLSLVRSEQPGVTGRKPVV
jgi:hypothetical protein